MPGHTQQRQRTRGWQRQLQLCEVLAEEVLLLHDEPVYQGGEIIGHCTSGGQGYRTGKSLCFVMFYRRDGLDDCRIEIAGQKFPVVPLYQPPYRAADR